MTDDGAPGGIHERVPGSGLKLWFLLGANRWAITGLVLAVVYVGVLAVLLVEPGAFDSAVQRGTPIESLFQALVTAVVTGVTLVVSINSLVLSQELGPAGKQREKMDDATAFRDDVAELIGAPVSPAEPAAFLRAMLDETAERAVALRDGVGTTSDREAIEEISAYAEGVERDARRAADRLVDAEFGTFDVVAGSLGYDYSAKLYEAKRLAGEHGDALDDDTDARLDDVRELLHFFGPAREHVKTLYFQWELVNLSRSMLYAAVPALVVSIASILVLGDPATVPGATLGLANQAWVVAGGATVALTPFAILLSYILRIATVAKRTLAIGPFVLHETGDSDGRSPED